MKLYSLDSIFERRILRIPDYQRGFAWQGPQIDNFWEDINRLDVSKIHYTGVITLEPVPNDVWGRWDQDKWIIDGLAYTPFYVVDGQQRLTTSMILMQAILERIEKLNSELEDGKKILLSYQSVDTVKTQYILREAENGQNKSFLFGYEKDDPSDEFLKTRIFNAHSHSDANLETLYTNNLRQAKDLFLEKLNNMEDEEISLLFKKLTQRLKFNLYEIDDEIDVFVTFETMNNRGKPLTSLELLKNRLIYLSTLFEDNSGREELRAKINNTWKTIYEYLGKNPNNPLDDNEFLRSHWIMYFKFSRQKGDDYINFLLDEKFTAKNVTDPEKDDDRVTIEDIDLYVTNLQKSALPWFYIHNPYYSVIMEYKNDQNKMLLERLERLSFRAFKPLLLASFVSNKDIGEINSLLIAIERYNFTLFTLSHRRANTGDSEFYGYAKDLLENRMLIPCVIAKINARIKDYYDPEAFYRHISEKYSIGQQRNGFYGWSGLRYFLYEYEQYLGARSRQPDSKLSWKSLSESENRKKYITVEHIFPQDSTDPYWQEHYKSFSDEEKLFLTHSLGNILPLSQAKNSTLQNDSFEKKKNNGEGVGYYNGSFSENEVSTLKYWRSQEIKERGWELLSFMEQRWDIFLGDEAFKIKLLHLDFLDLTEDTTTD